MQVIDEGPQLRGTNDLITVVKEEHCGHSGETQLIEANDVITMVKEERRGRSEETQLARNLFVKTNVYSHIMEASLERRLR